MKPAPRLILASRSPRRIQLLSEAGVQFEIVESGIVEQRDADESARDFALRMARAKALAVSSRASDALVLGADTVVETQGEILGKPESVARAIEMLKTLSGRVHNVVTAFALASGGSLLESRSVQSRVTFRELNDDQIQAYVATAEPMDKAGAYAVQGAGSEFIAAVEGSFTNVVGLPMDETMAALRRYNVTSEGPCPTT